MRDFFDTIFCGFIAYGSFFGSLLMLFLYFFRQAFPRLFRRIFGDDFFL